MRGADVMTSEVITVDYSDPEKRALIIAAECIPGVQRVEDHMRPVPAYLV
jgi:hypothetical protein